MRGLLGLLEVPLLAPVAHPGVEAVLARRVVVVHQLYNTLT